MTTNPQILLDSLLETVSLINPGTEPGKLKRIMGTAARMWLSIQGDRCGLDFFPFAVGYVTALAGVDECYGNDLNKIAVLSAQEARNDN